MTSSSIAGADDSGIIVQCMIENDMMLEMHRIKLNIVVDICANIHNTYFIRSAWGTSGFQLCILNNTIRTLSF